MCACRAYLEGVVELPEPWQLVLDEGEEELFSHEDDGHLQTQLHVASPGTALLQPLTCKEEIQEKSQTWYPCL